MPRVANPPTGKGHVASKPTMATPHKQSPVKLALNDDRGEKAARLQSRHALHEVQMNQIKAAASPMRKLNNYERAASESPKTPRSAAAIARQRAANEGSGNGSPGAINVVNNSAVTPMKRVPILANFEEWMKMATDNKINAANSWNFALIDYFHDMSLLKEGDGVNFQKASCTLDGCVKIYTSRVDSVATETGKLLSGLADSGNKKAKDRAEGEGEGEEGEGDDDEEEDENGVRKKTKKKTQRSHEATLAPSFASLQLKKMELEFAVDPLFKKASADFDEGGAKGLLLNHLSIDSEGRIVFDSSDDTGDAAASGETSNAHVTESGDDQLRTPANDTSAIQPTSDEHADIDIDALASKFFPDLSILDSQDICPSMKSFALGDPNLDLNIPFLKPPEDWRDTSKDQPPIPSVEINLGDQTGIFLDGTNAAGFDDDDDDGGLLGGFDLPPDTGFGEGGEAWVKDAALEPMLRVSSSDEDGIVNDGAPDSIAVGDFDPSNPGGDAYAISLNHRGDIEHENILFYFDNALQSQRAGWAGHEHWRVRKIKQTVAPTENPAPVRQRKEREPFEVDFLAPMSQATAEMVYTVASSNNAISLPKAQWKTKGRNLLPDDRHFSSKSLLGLFLKPKARLGRRNNVAKAPNRDGGEKNVGDDKDGFEEMDEAYWARRKEEEERSSDEARKVADYDANFFADDDGGLPFVGGIPDDDDDGDDDEHGPAGFTDAREMLSPPPSTNAPAAAADLQVPSLQAEMLPGSFGAQLVTQGGRRLRPEYVNYARVAKKVDVRRLKENMWRGMSENLMAAVDGAASPEDANGPPTPAPTDPDGDVDMMDVDEPAPPTAPVDKMSDKVAELKFTDMIGDLRKVYPEQQMRDISTSYCFICLLHLANEKGLVLEGGRDEESMREIVVRRDVTVGEGYVGE